MPKIGAFEPGIEDCVWKWASRTPDAVAITDGPRQVTYRELARQADELCVRLTLAGVGPEVLVAISASPSDDLIAGLLAILRAGGAYLPVDPSYPAERLQFLLDDSECRVVLTDTTHLAMFSQHSGALIVMDDHTLDRIPHREPAPATCVDRLAYVIYTSGSTGKPKGVEITQGSLIRLFEQTNPWFQFGPRDVWTQFHSFSFDFSVWEIWGALLYGGRLVIVSHETRRDPIAFRNLVRQERVTVLNQTPSAFSTFQRADALITPTGTDALRYVIFGGEALKPDSLRPWFDRHGDASPQLVNMYGITETTVHVTYRPLTKHDADDSRSLIGVPIPDLTLHLLDAAGKPVTPGEEGEIYVGGPGVARGYLRRSELTSARFVPDPFSMAPGSRLYRSGDLARRGADGELEYRGRIDDQVKWRGFRIELGEIEAALRRCHGVEDAAVVLHKDGTGESTLAGYLIPSAGSKIDLGDIGERLKQTLPGYSIPSALVVMDQLPLTAHGKLDREKLKAPVSQRLPTDALSGTAGRVAEFFGEILGVENAGLDLDFFGLGGTSLQAMRLSLAIAERLGVCLPAGTVFRCPTVRELANAVDEAQVTTREETASSAPVEWAPLSPSQEQIWLLQAMQPEFAAFHCPAAFRIYGTVDEARLDDAVRRACERHPMLRATFATADGRPAQKISTLPTFGLKLKDMRGAPLGVAEHIRMLASRPIDLAQSAGAASLLRLADNEYLFVIVLHHLVTDGWSLARLLEEIARDYNGETAPAPRLQFLELVAARRGRLESGAMKQDEEFWARSLKEAATDNGLPTEYARPLTPVFQSGRLSFSIPPSLNRRLIELAQADRCTVNSLLLSALATLLQRYTGQAEVVIGVPYAGRDEAGSERVQGLLMNLLAVRIELPAGTSFQQVMRETHRHCREAFAHAGVPLSRIVQRLGLAFEGNRQPLTQVVFAPQPDELAEFPLNGLKTEAVIADTGSTFYDLSLCTWGKSEGIQAELVYAADLFSQQFMEEFRDQFIQTLTSATNDPEQSAVALDIYPPRQRERLLTEWSGRAERQRRSGAALPSFLERFALAVRQYGETDSVVYGPERLSYRELDAWSNRIARVLKSRGVQRESLVAICCERSPAAMAAVLGVWKAGGAYVPLDPFYPAERLSWMLKDCGAAILLTTPLASEVVQGDAERIILDHSIGEYSCEPLTEHPDLATLAYVIYTSGSTGTPKGVMVEHRGIAALADAIIEGYPLPAGARILQYTSLSFDVCVGDIVAAFTQGATMVIPTQPYMLAGTELLEVLEKEKIAQTLLPMSVLAQLEARPLSGLIHLVSGGERCPAALADRWGAGRILINAYGPTEASVGATIHRCTPGEGDPPIGRALPRWTLYVLDRQGQPVPPLATGELYIGGDGLARGYLGRPELTRERFLDGLPNIPERLYKTGDLVRWRRDGSLEFAGRTDGQVKVRGFRIELGEIESALCAQPSVKSAAAIVDGEGPSARVVAYVVPADARTFSASTLLRELRASLPPQLAPSEIISLDALPLTPNGKVDRAALPRPRQSPEQPRGESPISAIWREVLNHDTARNVNFFDSGGTSLALVQLQTLLEKRAGIRIPLAELFAHPTIEAMERISGVAKEEVESLQSPSNARIGNWDAIAIVGMAARFPKAPDIETFWRNLCEGVEGISHFSAAELTDAGVSQEVLLDPQHVPARGVVEDDDKCDAGLFGIGANEAERMDPQHRLWLECGLAALEDSGYDPRRFEGEIGVFAGMGATEYLLRWAARASDDIAADYQLGLGNDKDFAASRLSYKLGLRGPSLSIQTACSSGLVAVYTACRQLMAGDCDMAIAGAVSLTVPSRSGYLFREGMILSPDGHCRPFDREARGTVPGDGGGAVVLKRLSDAMRDRDDIYAVIRGGAINNDGDAKAGYTAPSSTGQEHVITRALQRAGITAGKVSFVEAHGTATPMGDPIEFTALRRVFERAGAKPGQCALGSVKSNIGHLNTAAGIAGLIKTVLALRNQSIPGTLHFTAPNPEIALEGSPFSISSSLQPWMAEGNRYAGVSSFGVGGTNAHLVLSEAPALAERKPPHQGLMHVLPISAATSSALSAMALNLSDHLETTAANLTSLAYTLQQGRTERAYREFVVAADTKEAARGFRELRRRNSQTIQRNPTVAFLFPGEGSEAAGMCSALASNEPRMAEELARIDQTLRAEAGIPLLDILRSGENFDGTAIAQPILFGVEIALARVLMSWGVRPQAMLGHGLGEYVAACVAGVLSVEDAVTVVAAQGRLMQKTEPGAMLCLPVSEQDAVELLRGTTLDLAAVNSANHSVVAGSSQAVDLLLERLRAQGIQCERARTMRALHSRLMDPILDEYRQVLRRVKFKAPQFPFISCVTGDWNRSATESEYWLRQARETVRFDDGLSRLFNSATLAMEVGPGDTLSAFAQRRHFPTIATLGKSNEAGSEPKRFLQAVGEAWCAGIAVDWTAMREYSGVGRAHLPVYPFERKRYWGLPEISAPIGTHEPDERSWIYEPVWKEAPVATSLPRPKRWLVLAGRDGFGERLAEELGPRTIVVHAGQRFERLGELRFAIKPDSAIDIEAVLELFRDDAPDGFLHTFSLDAPSDSGGIDQALESGYFSIMSLVQCIGRRGDSPVDLTILSAGGQAVGRVTNPLAASLAGLSRVIAAEYPSVQVRHLDLDAHHLDAQVVLAALSGPCDVLAIRHGKQFQVSHEVLPFNPAAIPPLRKNGVYLITGGLGGLGLTLAEHLAVRYNASVVLASRNGLPPESEWGNIAASDREAGLRLAAYSRIRQSAAGLMVQVADIADADQARELVQSTVRRFGRLDGVVHAAGVTGGGLVQQRAREDSYSILRAKIHGTLALDSALKDVPHEFLFLCSSLTALGGVAGQADYTAANAFLDAFASQANTSKRLVLSVNWDGWKGVGVFARHVQANGHAEIDSLLTPAEGVQVFERSLASRRSNLAISKTPLLDRSVKPMPKVAPLHARPELNTAYAAPRTELERKIATIWQSHFRLESIGLDDDFFDLGGDSLLAVQVAHDMRLSLQGEYPAQSILENPTIRALAARDKLPVYKNLVALAGGPENTRPIFLVHPIGGHVYFYLPMAKKLSATAPVYGLQAQGADGEAAPLGTIEQMATQYIAAIRSIQPRGPYRLAGSSFGGVVCFEMAQQLTAAGESVDLLAMVDSPAPWSIESFFRSDAEILAYLMARGGDPERHFRELSGLSEDEMLCAFVTNGGAAERLGPTATADSVRHFLRLFRANFDALTRYRPRRYASDGLFFHATEHDAYNTTGYVDAWRPLFERLESIAVPGNHTCMYVPSNCDAMVHRIETELRTSARAAACVR